MTSSAGSKREVLIVQAHTLKDSYLVARSSANPPLWADGRTCTALADLPGTLTALEAAKLGTAAPMARPSATKPGATEIAAMTRDGPTFAVTAPGAFAWNDGARVRLDASGGRVKLWVEASLKALGPCWRDTPPANPPKDDDFER